MGKKRTHNEYVEELSHINPNIYVIGEFSGVGNHILHKCKICDYEWSATPNNILHGNKCPECSKKNRTKTHDDFCDKLFSINDSINILTKYTNAKTKIDCECKICNYVWSTLPYNLERGHGCPKCANLATSQKLTKTDEYFQSKLPEKIKSNIKIKSKYSKSDEKVNCECLICGYEWKAVASSLIQGKGCIKCGYQMTTKALTKSHQEFVDELLLINNNIELLSPYTRSDNKIKCRCLICNNIWEPLASSLLNGKSCPYCYGNYKLTHDEFLEKLPEKTKYNIEFLSSYVNAKTLIQCKCKICDYIWSTTSNNLYKGGGCRKCAGLIPKTNEEFLNTLPIHILNNVILDGEYKNSKSVIHCTCKKCGYTWDSITERLLLGNGCRKCADRELSSLLTMSHDEYVERVKVKNPIVSIIGRYSGSHNKVMCKCKICDHEWESIASSILCGRGCPICSSSSGERIINYLLSEMDIKFEYQKSFSDLLGVNGGLLSYDFYLPEHNLLIEFQGKQHERPIDWFGGQEQFIKQQEHDKRKRNYAKVHGIKLLEIWYYDSENIEKILNKELNNLKLESVETTGVA